MSFSPYNHMQNAVDIVNDSPHPTNKIAATLAGTGPDGQEFSISRTNAWPSAIVEKIGTETKIGNSSGTVHAEMACLLAAPMAEGATMFVTDPPCPNCAKYMAEAGVKALYIDHKGFDKDWAQRRGEDFDNMSMRIFAKAGIGVFEIFRKEARVEPILEIPEDYIPVIESPADIGSPNADIATDHGWDDDAPNAQAFVETPDGEQAVITVNAHPVIGYTSATIEEADGKYSYMLQPVNRILMIAARKGWKLLDSSMHSSRVPTSRELINFVAAGQTSIDILHKDQSRDEHGLQALKQLQDAGVLDVR